MEQLLQTGGVDETALDAGTEAVPDKRGSLVFGGGRFAQRVTGTHRV